MRTTTSPDRGPRRRHRLASWAWPRAWPPASADPSPSGTSAGTWLAGELTNGRRCTTRPVRLRRLRAHHRRRLRRAVGWATRGRATQIRNAVAAHINDYITGERFGDPAARYAGPTAKALVWPSAPARTRRRSAGSTWSAGSRPLVGAVGPDRRRQHVRRLRQHDRPVLRRPRAHQRRQRQGRRGDVVPAQAAVPGRLLPARPRRRRSAATTQHRPRHRRHRVRGAGPPEPEPDPPSTRRSPRRSTWLKTTQAADGSFGGGPSPRAPTPTAPASPAGRSARPAGSRPPNKAAAYVRSFQVPAGQTGPLATEVGAVAYDAGRQDRRPDQRDHRRDQRPVAARDRAGRPRAQPGTPRRRRP